MKKFAKISAAVAAVATLATAAAPAAVLAYGDNTPNGPSRNVYTIEQIRKGDLGDTITFNSITDFPQAPIGDERNFVGARINDGTANGTGNVWNADEIEAKNGQEYYVRLYAHNNSPKGENGVAKDVTVGFGIPGTSGTELKVTGYITSSNATPTEYWDSVVFKSSHKFHLEYVAGSAYLENNLLGAGGNGGAQLSDDIVKTGVKIGYESLNGEIPGCYQYASYTRVKVKVVYDYDYTVEKYVRRVGDKEWKESIDAKEGEEVEYMILYTNTSNDTQNNVVIKDVLPKNMDYVNGSTVLYNANHKAGEKNTDNTITTSGINIGNYTAGANAYVIFRAKVVNRSLVCGTTKVVNWGQVGVGTTTLQDSASVFVKRDCGNGTAEDNPGNMPATGPESIVTGVIGLGAITTAGGYFIASRKKLVK